LVKISESDTLDTLLDFIEDEISKDEQHRLAALRVHFLFLEHFLQEFWENTEKSIPVPFADIHNTLEEFADTGAITVRDDFDPLLEKFISVVPDADNFETEWQNAFSQDALFCLEALLRHFRSGHPEFATLFTQTVNTFGKFCELISERISPDNVNVKMQELLRLSHRNVDSSLKNEIKGVHTLFSNN